MTNITRYNAADLSTLMDRIVKNSIGMDDYFDSFWNQDHQSNYPPYNLVQVNNVESRLEIALAGFKKKEVKVFTEFGKLHVEGKKEESETVGEIVYKGLAQRSFTRAWSLSDQTEVRSVEFENGLLTIKLSKVIPEAHKRKEWF